MIDTLYNFETADDFSPVPSIRIRRMCLEDVEHVSRLDRKCYALPWNSNAYVTEIGNPKAYYTVAVDSEETIVGYAGMWVIMDEAHLTTIAVDPDKRGMKIGERLLIDMLEFGMAHGAERATLEVREHNLAAHNLYLKYGFVDVGARRSYYSDNGENAIIMWADYLIDPEYLKTFQMYKEELTTG